MSSRRRRKAPRTRRIDGGEAQQRQAAEASAAFWHGTAPEADGSTGAASETDILTERRVVAVTPDPTSTVRSLGKPPLAGRETVAEHYFEAVYQRSVAMAGALAAAGGLLCDESDSG